MGQFIKICFCIFLSISISYAQNKQICITIDDLPVVSYGKNDPQYLQTLTQDLLKPLESNGIEAIGFVNEIKAYKNNAPDHIQVELLRSWLRAGQDLGNHTYSHLDYNSATFEKYADEIEKGESITSELLIENKKNMKYFRHPYLHLGPNKQKADSLQDYLDHKKYIVAPVTIDNDDYLFAFAYHKTLAKNDMELARKIGADYIKYMEQKIKYFENQSQKLFDKNIPQILLLHANKLNADYLAKLIEMYKSQGYSFINLETALKDPVYKTPITTYGKYGISWIDRWALSMGKTGGFFADDVATPEYIKQLAGN